MTEWAQDGWGPLYLGLGGGPPSLMLSHSCSQEGLRGFSRCQTPAFPTQAEIFPSSSPGAPWPLPPPPGRPLDLPPQPLCSSCSLRLAPSSQQPQTRLTLTAPRSRLPCHLLAKAPKLSKCTLSRLWLCSP